MLTCQKASYCEICFHNKTLMYCAASQERIVQIRWLHFSFRGAEQVQVLGALLIPVGRFFFLSYQMRGS